MKRPLHSILWDIWNSQGLFAFMWFFIGAGSMFLVAIMVGMYYNSQ